jgi:hypothetical protein
MNLQLSKTWTGLLLITVVGTVCTVLYPDDEQPTESITDLLSKLSVHPTSGSSASQSDTDNAGDVAYFEKNRPFSQFYKVPPPPPPAKPKVIPPPVYVRPPTHFPFKYMGQMINDKGQRSVFLMDDDQPVVIHPNETYENTWQMTTQASGGFVFTYLPTHETFRLSPEDRQ